MEDIVTHLRNFISTNNLDQFYQPNSSELEAIATKTGQLSDSSSSILEDLSVRGLYDVVILIGKSWDIIFRNSSWFINKFCCSDERNPRIPVDNSSSICFYSGRIDSLISIVQSIASTYTAVTPEDRGIDVRFMNPPRSTPASNRRQVDHVQKGHKIRTPEEISELIRKTSFRGVTRIAHSLEAQVLQPFLYNGSTHKVGAIQRPLHIIVVTDGEVR